MGRRAVFTLLLSLGCGTVAARPPEVTLASTLQKPAAPQSSPSRLEDGQLARLLDEAVAERARGDVLHASETVLSIVCGGQKVLAEEQLRRCPTIRSPEVGTAWVLVAELAFEGVLAFGSPQPVDLGGVAADQLAIAAMAYERALRVTPSRMPRAVVLYKLGWAHYRLDRFDAALGSFLEALEAARTHGAQSPADELDVRDEALEYAAISIAETDWDGDGQDDPVRGFDRPQIKARLEKETPDLPDLYVRVVSVLVDQAECLDATAALAAASARFPRHPKLPELMRSLSTICP